MGTRALFEKIAISQHHSDSDLSGQWPAEIITLQFTHRAKELQSKRVVGQYYRQYS